MPDLSKTCTKCKQTKSQSEFYTKTYKGRTRYQTWCKPCSLADHKTRYTPQRDFKSKLKLRYNLTWEQYIDLYNKQQGQCKICTKFIKVPGKTTQPKSEMACVDHDHQTGRIRGLLCSHCNTMLGLARDSTFILSNAISYLKSNN